MSRPLVGITVADDDRRPTHHSLRRDYVRAVESGGALAVGLPALLEPGAAGSLLERLDGLVLSGGSDLDPGLYGQAAHPAVAGVVRQRDEFELALCREALSRDLPILAICRGHQVLNVATGGTLIQDIPSLVAGAEDHDPPKERWEKAHEVRVEPGSRLHGILGRDRIEVNSFHHQAIGRPGSGIVISASCPKDGIIEAVELPGRRFAIGVQWHPESFWNQSESHQVLFAALAQACSRR